MDDQFNILDVLFVIETLIAGYIYLSFMGNYLMSDVEKIERVLQVAADLELNLDSQYARNFLAKSIKHALDNDDTDIQWKDNLPLTFDWRL